MLLHAGRIDAQHHDIQLSYVAQVVPQGRELPVSVGGIIPHIEHQDYVLTPGKVAQGDGLALRRGKREVWSGSADGKKIWHSGFLYCSSNSFRLPHRLPRLFLHACMDATSCFSSNMDVCTVSKLLQM